MNIPDISHGREQVAISCVNALNTGKPDPLVYSGVRMPQKDVNLNTNTDFMVCCDCTDNCQVRCPRRWRKSPSILFSFNFIRSGIHCLGVSGCYNGVCDELMRNKILIKDISSVQMTLRCIVLTSWILFRFLFVKRNLHRHS